VDEPVDLGNKLKIILHVSLVFIIAAFISALSCNPNASGFSNIGSFKIYSL
jgi:hypothetical protein